MAKRLKITVVDEFIIEKIPVVIGASIVIELFRELSSHPDESDEVVEAFDEFCLIL